jgi:hypothetical protein
VGSIASKSAGMSDASRDVMRETQRTHPHFARDVVGYLVFAAALITGCSPPKVPSTVEETAAHLGEADQAMHRTPPGIALLHVPEIRASVRGPSRATYVAEALGAAAQSVSIQLMNTSGQSVNVGRLRVAFSATREGVPFQCKEHQGGRVKDREVSTLAPQQSFVFERDLDCAMPLPGTYEVRTYVALTDAAKGERGDFAGAFSLTVADSPFAPRPYLPRPGLYAAMTGNRTTAPLLPEAWSRGDYHVVLALVNGSTVPVAAGQARLAFSTYRKGSPLPCSGQTEKLDFPAELAPGSVHVTQAPVACAPSEEGRYEIVGRLRFDEAGEGVEVGRVAVKVTRDPLLFEPQPWLPWADRSSTWTK